MHIVMHCMGMPFNGDTINTSSLGGSESAAYYLAKELATAGHSVYLFTSSPDEGEWDGVTYINVGNVTEQAPLGDRFHFYAMNTPHDVCVIQRSPVAFRWNWASKVNLWWVHDLALYRTKDVVQQMLWNVDAVLTVSDYHTDQITSVYGIDKSICHNIQNGIDLALFKGRTRAPSKPYRLVYSSRPERGLERLVRPGGIMERLGPDYELAICAYQNVTEQMRPLYEQLYTWADALPNVKNMGYLTKQQLAQLFMDADLLVYPTTFEEVSCITAMEAMAAGLPMITSDHAALLETCKDSGTVLIPVVGDMDHPDIDIDAFCQAVKSRVGSTWDKLHEKQLQAAKSKTWESVAGRFTGVVFDVLGAQSRLGKTKRMLLDSDYYQLSPPKSGDMAEHIRAMLDECYGFTDNEKAWGDHYESYYQYEKARGVEYGPEKLDGENRFETVAQIISSLPRGAVVLDYGCAHGHYTINLAKRFKDKTFIGVDIAQSNISKAEAWAHDEGIENVRFICDDYTSGLQSIQDNSLDAIIAAEVLEHMADPVECLTALSRGLKESGRFVITTPFGPWEAIGYKEHYPWRAHVHHFERQDIIDLYGNSPGFELRCVPANRTAWDDLVGSYVYTFGVPADFGSIDISRKQLSTKAAPTVSLCMIVKDAEDSLQRAVDSVIDIVDEVIIGIDIKTKDNTSNIVNELANKNPLVRFEQFSIESPLSTGFDAARNTVINKANCDWILWLDSDEKMVNAQRLVKYLRNNHFNGYAIKQHHFSVDPLGVIKTDLPVKIFRNHLGIQFYGRAHEHPELGLNKGVGHAWGVPDVDIVHDSYMTEAIRRNRFRRNIGLMERDRKEHPERTLGKMLWIRDVAQMAKFEVEQTQMVSDHTRKEAENGISLWRDLCSENLRMAVDSLHYYSTLVSIVLPESAVDYSFSVDVKAPFSGAKPDAKGYSATFYSADDAHLFRDLVEREKSQNIGSRYA